MELHNDNLDDATGAFCSMVPDPEIEERAATIGHLTHHLAFAGPDQDQVAFRLDLALCELEKLALGRNSRALDRDEHMVLSDALTAAATAGYAQPPTGLDRQQVMYGLLIVAQILNFWALPDDRRRQEAKLAGYLRDLARVFRNHLHNANLLNRVRGDLDAIQPWRPGASLSLPDLKAVIGLLDYPVENMRLFIDAMAATRQNEGAA